MSETPITETPTTETPITPERRAALQAVAESVPGGEPWRVQRHGADGSYVYVGRYPCDGWVVVTGADRVSLSEFVAAFDPPTALALLDALDRGDAARAGLEAERNRLKDELKLSGYERSSASEAAMVLLKALGWESGGLAAAAIEIVADRDALRQEVAALRARLAAERELCAEVIDEMAIDAETAMEGADLPEFQIAQGMAVWLKKAAAAIRALPEARGEGE